MIDPLVSLAFSLQANRGAYTLLIGSGVSRAAGIPTGWEITVELVKKVAAASGSELGSSPEEWFQEKYGKEPDYSDLLDQLCKSASERQQYLKGFFEPTAEEREEGVKGPTQAHHAIAELMAEGYVRVIVTTNFDRLLEQALEARGIVPVVISNADQAKGMLPLVHQKHCIVKVHGDYLDTRIMNTDTELANYSPEMDRLLDQIFDEFGMILCGWSGAWDPALRSAIVRAPSRRFSSYWAVRGTLGKDGQKLAGDRGTVPIQIESADGFFSKLVENLASLREYDRPHPLSVQSAVASLKRYLAEDRYRIRLHDLLIGTVQDTQQRWKNLGIEMKSPRPDEATTVSRIKAYDASMELLLPMGLELGKWARPEHFPIASELLQSLADSATLENGSFDFWRQLSRYPATQLLFAIGISALKADNIEFIGRLFSADLHKGNRKTLPTVAELFPMCLVERNENLWPLFDGQKRYTPLSDWLESNMRRIFAPSSSADQYNDPFTPIFDEFEMLGAVAYRALIRGQKDWLWVPYGCWGWRRSDDVGHLERLKNDLEANGVRSKLMRLGIFKNGPTEAHSVLDEVIEFAGKLNLW
jgi:hypothetical protein